MSGPLLLGIDEGTTAVKASLFDARMRVVRSARRELALSHPRPGWAEQDPELILEAVVEAVADVLEDAAPGEVLAAGLDHQGESVLAWEAGGEPLSPVLVWQDKRQEQLLAGIPAEAAARSGLPLDPYFSAGKLAWLLAHDERVQDARRRGSLRLGTVDCFLVERLAGRYQTDLSTASRTQLMAAGGEGWDERLLELFGIDRELLPEIVPTFGALGELRHERWLGSIPLCAQLVDQQAALAGSGAVRPGSVKASYGTGVFVLGVSDRAHAPGGLLPTVAWASPAGVVRALDGGVFSAGALLDWLARGLGLAPDTQALLQAARSARGDSSVMVLPALAGLGAPWWQPQTRAVIAGLEGGSGAGELARAALEAIAMRVADIVDAFGEAVEVGELRVDGGLSNDALLLQLQADALGIPLRTTGAEATVAGAALLAGVGAGLFGSIEEAAELLPEGRAIEPLLAQAQRLEHRERWRAFVAASSRLVGYSTVTS